MEWESLTSSNTKGWIKKQKTDTESKFWLNKLKE